METNSSANLSVVVVCPTNQSIVVESCSGHEGADGAFEYLDFTQITAVCALFIILYIVVMTLALSGNFMVCYVVFSNRKMHTVVNYYIVNLAASDFMVGAFVLPFKLLELTAPAEWGALSDGMCTAMLYLQTIFVFASVLTLVATCVERYFAILHPLESRMQQSKSRAKKILLAVWLTPVTVALPFLYEGRSDTSTISSHYGTISRRYCYNNFSAEFRIGFYTFLFIFIYIVPLVFIAGTCFRIARCLVRGISFHRQGSLRRQEANRRKVAKMIMVVVVGYTVSWTPYFLVTITTQYAENFLEKHNFFFTMLCINLFAFLNSCVNPFIYAAMSSRFRNGFKRILRWIICSARRPRYPLAANKRNSSRYSYNRPMLLYVQDQNMSESTSQSDSGSLQNTGHAGSLRSMRSLVSCITVKRRAGESVRSNGVCSKCSPSELPRIQGSPTNVIVLEPVTNRRRSETTVGGVGDDVARRSVSCAGGHGFALGRRYSFQRLVEPRTVKVKRSASAPSSLIQSALKVILPTSDFKVDAL